LADTFIALDIETANSWYGSICQIGLVRSNGGSGTQERNFLINPETYFDSFNVSIHGIDEDAVKRAPTFDEVWSEIVGIVAEHTVAHHGPFDRASLNQATAARGLVSPNFRWLDTMRVVRRHWQDRSRSGYGLKPVCEMLGFEFEHHDAVADARAAAFILNHVISESGESLEWWIERAARSLNKYYQDGQKLEGNPDGVLAGEAIVFTGALSLPRSEIAAIAAAHGCNVAPGVTKKTTILVVGEQDLSKLAGYDKSSKQRKAEELVAMGHSIRIMGEQGFIAAMELEQSEVS
jgi:DNA polymerase III subunit epsilon